MRRALFAGLGRLEPVSAHLTGLMEVVEMAATRVK